MSKIRIVTDSSALFVDPGMVRKYNISIIPMYVRFGEERFKLGLEIGPEEFLHRLRYHEEVIPILESPSPEEFRDIYLRLNRETTKIVSLHMSAHLSDICDSAVAASKMLLGRCDIAIIDAQTLSAGLGLLVEYAAKLAQHEEDLEEMVRLVRRAIGRVYSVFYVQTMKTICHHQLISEAQTILGTMLGIMPFITVEEGQLVIMEKALSTSQAVEKLVEFASEFSSVDKLILLSHSLTLTEAMRQLQDRLALELSMSNFPTQLYDGSIATFLGHDATGLVIFEAEEEDYF